MAINMIDVHTDLLREYMRIKEYKEAGAVLLKYSDWKKVTPVEVPTVWLIEQSADVITSNRVTALAVLFDQHIRDKLKAEVLKRLQAIPVPAKQEVYYALSDRVPRGHVLRAVAQVAWHKDYVVIHPHDLEEIKQKSIEYLIWVPLEEQHQDPSTRAKYD